MNINTVEKIYKGVSPSGYEHSGYELTLMDGSKFDVPLNSENRHYQAIQEWIAEGNTVIDNPPE